MASRKYFIGIDGGGTKTLAVVIDRSGEIKGHGKGGAGNCVSAGLSQAVTSVRNAVNKALCEAKAELSEVAAICAGLAGVGLKENHEAMKNGLVAAFGRPQIDVITDAEAALAGATNLKPGVILNSGTGSIGFGKDHFGKERRSGGHGPEIGDEGSATWIGRRTVQLLSQVEDGRLKMETHLLQQLLCEELTVNSFEELKKLVYRCVSMNGGDLKSLRDKISEITIKAAQLGDTIALKVMEEAAIELGRIGIAVCEQLDFESKSFQLSCVGSVFENYPRLIRLVRNIVLAEIPTADFQNPVFQPEVGAAKLAQYRFKSHEQSIPSAAAY
jgi:N-acetylglucosamine kinase-like BadF-type ATPase